MHERSEFEEALFKADWIIEKVKNSDVYAQNLYAALCNTQLFPECLFRIIKEDSWGCSWRYAGGLVAELKGEGDYMDWYCSGSTIHTKEMAEYVFESYITTEIEADIRKLGWIIVPL